MVLREASRTIGVQRVVGHHIASNDQRASHGECFCATACFSTVHKEFVHWALPAFYEDLMELATALRFEPVHTAIPNSLSRSACMMLDLN